MAEEWREIPNTDYSVSSEGRVASRKLGGWRVLRTPLGSTGYPRVNLSVGGVCKSRKVHALVAGAFLGPKPTPKHEINHIDGDRTNNRANNLEWVTRSGNLHHRYDILKHGAARGEKSGSAKLTEVAVREIRRRRAAGEALKTIAADYGIHRVSVGEVANRKKWGWLPG